MTRTNCKMHVQNQIKVKNTHIMKYYPVQNKNNMMLQLININTCRYR